MFCCGSRNISNVFGRLLTAGETFIRHPCVPWREAGAQIPCKNCSAGPLLTLSKRRHSWLQATHQASRTPQLSGTGPPGHPNSAALGLWDTPAQWHRASRTPQLSCTGPPAPHGAAPGLCLHTAWERIEFQTAMRERRKNRKWGPPVTPGSLCAPLEDVPAGRPESPAALPLEF